MNTSTTTFAQRQSSDDNGAVPERANNLKETCHRLGCSRSSLYAMAGRGLIEFRKISGRTVVMESEIMRVLWEAPQAAIRTQK